MKNTLIVVLLAVVIGFGVYTTSSKKAIAPAPQQPSQSTNQPPAEPAKVAASHCGLTVNSPMPTSGVIFPLIINATVDNTQMSTLGCSWTVFEGQAGTVDIKDAQGATLAIGVLQTTSNWMTTAPTVYTSTITSLSNSIYTGPLNIIFTEENPADFPTPDTLTVSVIK